MATGAFTHSSKRVHKNVQKRYKIFKPRQPEGTMHVRNMRCFVMFVTAVCFLFLLTLKWPKNKSFYDLIFSGFLMVIMASNGIVPGRVVRMTTSREMAPYSS